MMGNHDLSVPMADFSVRLMAQGTAEHPKLAAWIANASAWHHEGWFQERDSIIAGELALAGRSVTTGRENAKKRA